VFIYSPSVSITYAGEGRVMWWSVSDEWFGKNVAGSGSCLNLSYGRDGKNAKYNSITDLLVIPSMNRSEKHNVRKAVVYVCVCVCVRACVNFIYCVEGWETERYRDWENFLKSLDQKKLVHRFPNRWTWVTQLGHLNTGRYPQYGAIPLHFSDKTIRGSHTRREPLRWHALLQCEHVINCNRNSTWVHRTVSLQLHF